MQLAKHIMLLNNNDNKYNRLLDHKINQNVSNEHLRKEIRQRNYETNSIIEDFECFVCQRTIELLNHTHNANDNSKNVKNTCTDDLLYPKMRSHDSKNRKAWQNIFLQGKCEANLLNEFVLRNRKFSKEQFRTKLLSQFENRICGLE